MKRTAFKILTLPLVLYSQAYADLIGFPDDLISDKGQTRVEFGLSYGNATSYNCSDLLSCTRSNIDSLTISPGLRYGINQTTELYSRFNWYSSRSHNTNILSLEESKSEANRFHDLWIGINHRVLDDAKYPGVLLFAEGAAMENVSASSGNDWVYGKTFVAGATIYRSIDPIILSATASYRYALARDIPDFGSQSIDPGDSLLFNPSISFAANNEISITSGFQWQRQNGIKSDIYSGHTTTRTDLTLGMGYMWSDDLTLHVSTSTDMTGDGGSNISLLALYSLSKESKKPESTPSKNAPKEATPTVENIKKTEPQNIMPVIATTAVSTTTPTVKPTPSATSVVAIKQADKTVWLECTKVVLGWDKETMKCKEIQEESIVQPKPIEIKAELEQSSARLAANNPKHFTLDISIHPDSNEDAIAQDLQKSRVSFKEPSFIHRLSKKRVAVAVGDFTTRDEALRFLNSLQFVTNKSEKNIRTFGGIVKESISTR